MKKYFLIVTMLISAATMVACGGNEIQKQTQGKAALVNDVEVDEFKSLISEKPGIILDVRTPSEVAEGKVPGAMVINIQEQDFMDQISKLDKDKPIYVYCRAGGRSANASQKLVDLGFPQVYNMLGGMEAWNAKGYEKE